MRKMGKIVVIAKTASKSKSLRIIAFTGIGIITLIILWITLLFFALGCFHKTSDEETSQYVNWKNGFEHVEKFRKATATELRKAVEDCILRGDCWIEKESWLEVGIIDAARKYKLAPDMGDASITSEIAYEGEKSAKIVSYEVPPGYKELFAAVAHYVRRQFIIKEDVYEVGAWFYVPGNKDPLVIVGMEYHPSWVVQYFAYAAIDTRDGSVLVPNPEGWTKVGQVEFEYNNWFKLWVIFDLTGDKEKFSIGYKSSSGVETFEGDVWVGYCNPAYMGYKAFNFYAGLVSLDNRGGQELYLDNFYARKVDFRGWLLLKKDGFEYEKIFDFPKNWQEQSAHPEYEWHLEKPDQHAQTTTELSLSGNRSAKLWTVPQPGKNVRSVLVAPDFTYWDSSLKRISVYFYLLEGRFGKFDAGIWLDVDLYDHENGKWLIAIVGFNREGLIKYGTGYGETGGRISYVSLDGGFTIECNKWYRAELIVDFSRFGGDDGMIFRLYIDGKKYRWKLPLTAWTDYMIYNFSFGAYYFGISNYLNYEAVAYFDEVEIYVGAEERACSSPKSRRMASAIAFAQTSSLYSPTSYTRQPWCEISALEVAFAYGGSIQAVMAVVTSSAIPRASNLRVPCTSGDEESRRLVQQA